MTRSALSALERPAGRGERPRGVALLIVLVMVALMSSAVVEYAYTSRVTLATASNERDRTKAYFLARSAVSIATLLLQFQLALERESGNTEDEMGRLMSRAIRRSNFQIYQYVDLLMKPFHSGKLETPVGGIDLERSGVEGFGDFTGEFTALVVPEAGRINVNSFASGEIQEDDLIALCSMMADARFNDLFLEQDELGDTMSRQRVLQNIIDFIDPDRQATQLSPACAVLGEGGDENRPYDRAGGDRERRPRNARLTHIEDLHFVHGVGDEFMREFGDKLTVYDVGKPNINVASAPIFYSVLCRAARAQGSARSGAADGFSLCLTNPAFSAEVLYFAMALDGVRAFFDDPLTVLLAYVGTTNSKLLPSAKKGQPVAFLNTGQLYSYIEDFRRDPLLMAQFLQYSPMYQQLAAINPSLLVDPLSPVLPTWTVTFDRATMQRSVSTSSPQIFRIEALGRYGSTESRIEVVLDMTQTARRMPDEERLAEEQTDTDDVRAIKQLLNEERDRLGKGRVLYWREL